MPDVYLLTEGAEGRVAVPHLTLTFFDAGLALDKADGEPVWDSTWDQLEEMSPVERSVLPDGRDGVVIVVVERRPAAPAPLRARDGRPDVDGGVDPGPRRRPRTADEPGQTAVSHGADRCRIAVAAAGTVALLLLSAVHVIHF